MSNRINGDFDQQTIEAFRSAYAASTLTPEDQEFDAGAGLPTDVVLNTSPWIQHTGLWRANPGTERDFLPNQVLVPGAETESDEDEEALIEEDIDEFLSEVLGEEEEEDSGEEDDFLDEELEELIEGLLLEEEEEEEPGDTEGIDQEEFDALLESLEEELGEMGDDEEV